MRGLYAIALETERVTVTASAMSGIMIAVQCVAGAGDNVVIVSPLWPNFVGTIEIMGAEPRFAPSSLAGPQSPGRAALQAGLRRAEPKAQSNFTDPRARS